MLNAKQETFIDNIVAGMSQREAYKKAYNAKYQNDAIDNKASKLFNKDEVQARYKELMEKAQNDAIMTAIERKEWLSKVVKGEVKETYRYFSDGECYENEREADVSTKIKAVDTLNKMEGEYKTILGGTVEIKKKLEDIL